MCEFCLYNDIENKFQGHRVKILELESRIDSLEALLQVLLKKLEVETYE